MKPIIETTPEDSVIVWQQVPEGVSEPALLVGYYSDCISITQEGRNININYETVPELIKLLRNPQQ